jgi:hypothetical protein
MKANHVAVFSDGAEVPFFCAPDDDLWIAVAEQLPRDDPTKYIEYVLDEDGEEVNY